MPAGRPHTSTRPQGECRHLKGPLGRGKLDGCVITCGDVEILL